VGDPGIQTILSGLNAVFHRMSVSEARGALEIQGPWIKDRFILHVGSGLPRKNRQAVLKILERLGPQWTGHAVFAGEDLSGAMRERIRELGLEQRVHCVVRPTHEQLNALYCLAEALIFPSYSEGFGWPVLEAQASGCPVICSNRTSVPEVAGTGAVVCDPDDIDGMTRAVLDLGNLDVRQALINNGNLNLGRFANANMMQGYTGLYAMAMASARA
jgi:glycosyltransferase involved in cell wall biosynthesis